MNVLCRLSIVLCFVLSCSSGPTKKDHNPAVYFEIPVVDMNRAIRFYQHVFGFDFEQQIIDQYNMALFPFSAKKMGISGALAKGDVYKPSKEGVILYLYTEQIDLTLALIQQQGGKILYPKTDNGDLGYVAEFEDSEGNRIALHQSK